MFKEFLNTRTGFLSVATLLGGVSYFFCVGLAIDSEIKSDRKQLLEARVEQRVAQELEKQQVTNMSSNGTPSS